jgi:D-xylose 1-dehydrogenase
MLVSVASGLTYNLGTATNFHRYTTGAVLTERQKRLWLTEAYEAEILSNQALKRMIVPEEVARLVLFLAADDSAAITHQSFVIDAG